MFLLIRGRTMAAVAALGLISFTAAAADASKTITVHANEGGASNCIPFGLGNAGPYNGFVYQNIPAFTLAPGDRIAFDNGSGTNAIDISMNIAMVATTTNGGDVPAGSFVTIVTDGTPDDPRGDAIANNYELRFTAEAPFSFPGGGLIIRTQATGAFVNDATCDAFAVNGDGSDSSGFFVERFIFDADGEYPWSGAGAGRIPQFRLELGTIRVAIE
jgi:hypothetical protein